MAIVVYGGSDPDEVKPEPPVEGPTDPAELQELVENLIQDPKNATILAWMWKASAHSKSLDFRVLQTGLALFSAPDSSTLEELNAHKPTLNRESLGNLDGTIFKVTDKRVSFINNHLRDLLDTNKILDGLGLWQGNDLEFLVARACVTYLSLDDFRDLPLPTSIKGLRMDLAASDPFLTYASCHWYKHIHSSEEAKLLELRLNQILDIDQNNLVLWTDQKSGSFTTGARTFVRSQSEIAVKHDIPWLVSYILETSGSSGPEDLFPARDLVRNVQTAPKTVITLVKQKPDYYIPALTKTFFVKALLFSRGGFDVMQAIIPSYENAHLPAEILTKAARNDEGDKIIELLFSKLKDVPITNGMVEAAARNSTSGPQILKYLFQKEPNIRVNEDMVGSALCSSNNNMLALLFEQDKEAPMNEELLVEAVQLQPGPSKMKYILSMRPDIRITPRVLKAAVKLSRHSTIKLFFEHQDNLEVTEDIVKFAATEGGNDMETIKFLLNRSDSSLITPEVLAAGARRLNSPDKVTETLLRHNPNVEISDELLIQAIKGDVDGRTLDILLEKRGKEEVPHNVVDEAIIDHKRTLSWSSRDRSTSLKVLQKRVPNDSYLKQKLDETDFEPPKDKETEKTDPSPTDVPDAASRSNIDKLKKLLDEGMDVNASHGTYCGCDRTKGEGTALQRAAEQRDIEMVKLLLEYGANPDLQNGKYGNPLQEAAMQGDLELVKILLEHKASINLSGHPHGSPLIAASKANDVNVVRYLLENGGDINFTDTHGWTPYLHAVAAESYEVIRFLLAVEPSLASIGELIALPPSKMLNVRKVSRAEISEDGLTMRTDGIEGRELQYYARFLSDHPIIPTLHYYFEVTIVRLGSPARIAVGFGSMSTFPFGPLGSRDESWGYRGRDGHVLEEGDQHLRPQCPPYGAGDVVGCGIDFASKTAYFTKNGVKLDATLYMISGMLAPMIGIGDDQTEVVVNFGESPFMYQDY